MEVNKILMKLPKLNELVFEVFPMLHILSEEYPKAEINLLIEKGDELAFNFLPFKVNVYLMPKEKMSFFEAHRFVANLHEVFNIDVYLDLESNFITSFIGFNFRAKIRMGLDNGWNKNFLTKFFPNTKQSLEQLSMMFLESLTQKSFSEFRLHEEIINPQIFEKVKKLFDEPVPPKFILIMLYDFKSVEKEIAEWKAFFDSFQNQKFIIWTRNDEDVISEIFAKIDLGANELYMHRGALKKEMLFLFSKIVGVVTTDLWALRLGEYFGLDTLFWNLNQIQYKKLTYFKNRSAEIKKRDDGSFELMDQKEEKIFQSINQVADQVYFQFKL